MGLTLKDWIAENRAEIDYLVSRAYSITPADDDEREDWVMNDEKLYIMAQSEGVNI